MIYLEMNHVRKSFGDLEVLKDISLKVEEGEVLSIIGPSGSGKSTLLRCAAMLETMEGGDLTYLGERQSPCKMENPFMQSRPCCGKFRKTLEWYSRASTCFHIMM